MCRAIDDRRRQSVPRHSVARNASKRASVCPLGQQMLSGETPLHDVPPLDKAQETPHIAL